MTSSTIQRNPVSTFQRTHYRISNPEKVHMLRLQSHAPFARKHISFFNVNSFENKIHTHANENSKIAKIMDKLPQKRSFLRDCKSSKCKTWGNSHNTLLHHDTHHSRSNSQEAIIPEVSLLTINKCSTKTSTPGQVLLPTAEVFVFDEQGNKHIARVLLDWASQSNFITQKLVNKLGLKTENINTSVWGNNSRNVVIKTQNKSHI